MLCFPQSVGQARAWSRTSWNNLSQTARETCYRCNMPSPNAPPNHVGFGAQHPTWCWADNSRSNHFRKSGGEGCLLLGRSPADRCGLAVLLSYSPRDMTAADRPSPLHISGCLGWKTRLPRRDTKRGGSYRRETLQHNPPRFGICSCDGGTGFSRLIQTPLNTARTLSSYSSLNDGCVDVRASTD